MRFVTAAEMRLLDARAESECGIPASVLMRHAGLAVAEAVRRHATPGIPALLFAGTGNNGGDAFAAALFLREWGVPVRLLTTAPSPGAMRTPAARAFHEEVLACGIPVGLLPDAAPDILATPCGTVVADGLLGTGIRGNPRSPEAEAIRLIRRLRDERGAFVVAIDVPSGMDADTGAFGEPSVAADLTVTLALPKAGMAVNPVATAKHCGRVEVADIGLPDKSPKVQRSESPNGFELIAGSEVAALSPRRPRDAHKGDFGHVAVVGGSARYTGAVALAAEAALRGGAGLVTVATVREAAAALRVRLPEAIVREQNGPSLSREGLGPEFPAFLRRCGALVVGPGLGLADAAVGVLEAVLESGVRRAVVDADALTLLAAHPDLVESLPAETVLTPHPGEAARLLGTDAASVQRDRPGALRALVEKTRAAVILKGCGTLVGAPGRAQRLLLAGNPGMATAGSGDVLSGIVGAFLAQGLGAFDAACAGAWIHARNGDEAAWRLGEPAVLARDLMGR